ncbi:MAG: hypothetical protein HN919_22440 [Verrucomicrobia bacterium]|nr:hypothetical protein [Verrucomicrobiota bacterium]
MRLPPYGRARAVPGAAWLVTSAPIFDPTLPACSPLRVSLSIPPTAGKSRSDVLGEVPAVIPDPEGHQVRQEYLSHLMRGPARADPAGNATR